MKTNKHSIMIKRFSKTAIFVHWINAFAFFGLYLTGLPLYTEHFHWLYSILGSAETTMILHRVFAVVFIMPLIIALLFDRRSLFHWFRQIFSWEKHDLQFFLPFAKEFFGGHTKIPKQDFYNAGEKLNSLLQLTMGFILVISGVIIWFDQIFTQALVQWAFVLHNIGFSLAIPVVIGHVYLSIGHPKSRISMMGMTTGEVPVDYAREHHGRWYDEVKGEEQKQPSKGA